MKTYDLVEIQTEKVLAIGYLTLESLSAVLRAVMQENALKADQIQVVERYSATILV